MLGINIMIIKNINITKKFLISISVISILLFVLYIIYAIGEEIKNDEKNINKDSIKWVDFNVTAEAMKDTSDLDIKSHNNHSSNIKYNWIELLAYLACKNGNNFSKYKRSDLNKIISLLQTSNMSEITQNMNYYKYYYESYSAALSGFIGEYYTFNNNTNSFDKKYGLKAFSPIAKNYYYTHYDDFGNSRSYGFKRVHLGNDMMGSLGTPIIAVESGVIEHIGWNQYGGWRIGIRSFDSKRYYYYAHLQKDHPYVQGIEKGSFIKAGDVIRIFRYDWI